MARLSWLAVLSLTALVTGCGASDVTTTVPWTKPATFEGEVLHLRYLGGTCRVDVSTAVEETSHHVVVTISDTQEPNCTADAQGYAVDVSLDSPLGDRVVVDGACEGGGHAGEEECRRSPRPVEVTSCDDVRLPAAGVGEADFEVDEEAELLGIHFSDTRRGKYRNVSYTVRYRADPSCRSTPALARLIDRVDPAGW